MSHQPASQTPPEPRTSSFLATKLAAPPTRLNLVGRERLMDRLDEVWHSKLMLVSAPAGFGKTTLLSRWLAQRALSVGAVAWLTLDTSDNDPSRFWHHVIAAITTQMPGVGDAALDQLLGAHQPPIETVLSTLINDLVRSPQEIVLVLDDYHLIETLTIHTALAFLLEHMPEQMHLIIASRTDPPLPLSRLRIRSQVVELRARDLRFTLDETATFLNDMMGLQLQPEQIALLESRTEGWAAGLQITALSIRGRTDIDGFIRALRGSHRYILDFLVEEVLQRQPEHIQRFLTQTAILNRLNAQLCDAVVGQPGSQAVLEWLESTNLFIVALDDERSWYRYHQLFADMLRHRLLQQQPGLAPALHRRASEWYEHNDSIVEAIHHALAAQDTLRAAELVERHAHRQLVCGEVMTLRGWLDALPAELVAARPQLSIASAWMLTFRGELADVERYLAFAERALAAASFSDAARSLHGEIAAIRAAVAIYQGDPGRAGALVQQARAALPSDHVLLGGLLALTLEAHHPTIDDRVEASRQLVDAALSGNDESDLHAAIPAVSYLASVYTRRGRLDQTGALYRRVLQHSSHHRTPRSFTGLAHIGIADLLREQNDLAGAAGAVEQGIALGEAGGIGWIAAYGAVVQASIWLARRRLSDAQQALARAQRLAHQQSVYPQLMGHFASAQVRVWLACGDLTAAERWLRQSSLLEQPGVDLTRGSEYSAAVRVLITKGQLDEAEALLTQLLAASDAAGHTGDLIEQLVLQTHLTALRRPVSQALPPLARAVSLAAPQGYVRVFADQGPSIGSLLAQLPGVPSLFSATDSGYHARLLDACGTPKPTPSAPAAPAPPAPDTPDTPNPLSERELEVLRLVAAGRSNNEIAEDLIVAVSTVKTHIKHIYTKLDVKSRTQAVAQARRMRFL